MNITWIYMQMEKYNQDRWKNITSDVEYYKDKWKNTTRMDGRLLPGQMKNITSIDGRILPEQING